MGFYWAASYIFLRATTYVIQQSTGFDSAWHCAAIAKGVKSAWDRRQFAGAYSALRRIGAGPKPALRDITGQPLVSERA
eukprot:7833620-Pyramimonas_sp.AAC.1